MKSAKNIRGQNIGRALSLVNKFWSYCDHDEEFGEAMGAPMGELRPLIERSQAKGFRRIKRQVKAMTGLRWALFSQEVERRTSPRWVHFRSQIGREHGLCARGF